MKKTISKSGLGRYRSCQREYFLAYKLLRRSRKVSPALAFGSLWDGALEVWHGPGTSEERLLRAVAVVSKDPDPISRAKAEALLVGYTAQWADEPIELVATQVEFTVPILHPVTDAEHPEYQYTGLLDAVIRYRGRLLGLESKTSGQDVTPGSPYWQQVATLDPQVSMYLSGAKQAGFELEAMLYDVVKKPELRLGKAETPEAFRDRIAHDIMGRPDHYFIRREIVRLESEANAYAQDLWDYADMLVTSETSGRWPRNPDRCRQFGRPCDYLPVCTGEGSIDDDMIYKAADKRGQKREETPNVGHREDPVWPAA